MSINKTKSYSEIIQETRGFSQEDYDRMKDDPSYTDINKIIIPFHGSDKLINMIDEIVSQSDCTLETRFKCMFSGQKKIITKPNEEQIESWKKEKSYIDEEQQLCETEIAKNMSNNTSLKLEHSENAWKPLTEKERENRVLNLIEQIRLPFIYNHFEDFANGIIFYNFTKYDCKKGNYINLKDIQDIYKNNKIASGIFGDFMNTINNDGSGLTEEPKLMDYHNLSNIIATLSTNQLINILTNHYKKLSSNINTKHSQILYSMYIDFIGKIICTQYPGPIQLKTKSKINIGKFSPRNTPKELLNLYNDIIHH